jgi:hypothetical protein
MILARGQFDDAGINLFRDESWSTRFLASTVSYFIFHCGEACILIDESAPTGSAAPQIREGVMERPCRRRGRQRSREMTSKKKLPEELE